MEAVANNLAYSIQVAIAPNSSPEARLQASKFCNDYIQTTPPGELCQVGFILSSHSDPTVIRTGMQFLEHVAKFNWQLITEREQVKEKLFVLMQNGITARCPPFLQESLARVFVEIAKREWPQLWPNLFPRLFEIANSSDLALLVLRRMVEDVATLQTVDCQERRRELSVSLNAIAPEVINNFFRVLIHSVKEYQRTALEGHQRRAKVCLGCLLPYIEWTNPASFAKDNMIPTLFALFTDFYFQMNAADCVLQLVERKPLKKEDRFDIPNICFTDESFLHFIQATVTAQPNNTDFLQKLGDILIALAPNVVLGKVKVENFFQGCEKLAMREEAVAVLGATTAINHFLKTIEKEQQPNTTTPGFFAEVDKFLIRLLGLILQKFVAAPPKSLERQEMNRLKNEFSLLLRTVGHRVPTLYNEVNGWLRNSLNSPNSVQNFQWEALTLVVDAVASSVSEDDAAMIKVGLIDLETCHSKFNSEPSLELKSLILSLVSALFVFLSLAKKRGDFSEAHHRMMVSICDSMFKCFQIEDASTREVRRHSASLLIKLATKYPDVMVLAFDFIHSTASIIASKLTTMEYNNVLESLMLISNVWNDLGKQSAFLGSLFNAGDWTQISTIVDSPQSFITIFPEATFLEKRSLLLRNLHTVYSSLKRVKKLTKLHSSVLQSSNGQLSDGVSNKNITNGGGVVGGEHDLYLHPAYDHVCPLLPVILKLVKTLHSLLENTELSYVQELSEAERATVIGLQGYFHGGEREGSNDRQQQSSSSVSDPQEKDKSHRENIKTFVHNIQELAYGILGESCSTFGSRFYLIPQLSDAYLSFVGYNSQLLNDFRLRSVIRNVFRSFLLNCPTSQAPSVVIPFGQKFFPFMVERLVNRWTVIENAKSIDADGEEEKEVLENSSLRLLTKEYIELLGRILEKHSSSGGNSSTGESSSNNAVIADIEMDNNETEKSGGGGSGKDHGTEIGEVGIILLSDPTCFMAIVNCIVSCICWDDSTACLRAARSILLIWDRIALQTEVVKGTFSMALRAVCLWEESEASMDTLLRVVDTCFRSHFSDAQFIQMLKDWGAPETEIQKLIGLCQTPKNEKKRKDLLRKLVHNNPALERNKSPKSQWLKGLPQLKMHSSSENAGQRQRSPEIDLAECFSLIHKS